MVRAAMPALNWRGSNSILGFTSGLTSFHSSATNLTDSMELTSALQSPNGA